MVRVIAVAVIIALLVYFFLLIVTVLFFFFVIQVLRISITNHRNWFTNKRHIYNVHTSLTFVVCRLTRFTIFFFIHHVYINI